MTATIVFVAGLIAAGLFIFRRARILHRRSNIDQFYARELADAAWPASYRAYARAFGTASVDEEAQQEAEALMRRSGLIDRLSGIDFARMQFQTARFASEARIANHPLSVSVYKDVTALVRSIDGDLRTNRQYTVEQARQRLHSEIERIIDVHVGCATDLDEEEIASTAELLSDDEQFAAELERWGLTL